MKIDIPKMQLFDFFVFGLVTVVIVAGLSTLIDQQHLQFFEKDLSISYFDTNGDIVSDTMLISLCTAIPAVIVLCGLFVPNECDSKKSRSVKVCVFLLGALMSGLTAAVTTDIMKKVVGRARPVALYNCNYLGYKTAVDTGNYTMYNALATFGKVGDVSNCWASGAVADMWSSFPSGHASFSFSMMLFTHFVLTQWLRIEKHNFYGWRSWLAFGPIVLCAWISVTRIIDNKHHVDDVIAGVAIGCVCAYVAWRHVTAMTRHAMEVCGVEGKSLLLETSSTGSYKMEV